MAYWIYQSRSWKLVGIATFGMLVFCAFGISYRQACATQFEIVHEMKEQTLTQEQLFQKAGYPNFYRDQQKYGYYVEGEKMMAITFHEDGTCEVSDKFYWWLD